MLLLSSLWSKQTGLSLLAVPFGHSGPCTNWNECPFCSPPYQNLIQPSRPSSNSSSFFHKAAWPAYNEISSHGINVALEPIALFQHVNIFVSWASLQQNCYFPGRGLLWWLSLVVFSLRLSTLQSAEQICVDSLVNWLINWRLNWELLGRSQTRVSTAFQIADYLDISQKSCLAFQLPAAADITLKVSCHFTQFPKSQ